MTLEGIKAAIGTAKATGGFVRKRDEKIRALEDVVRSREAEIARLSGVENRLLELSKQVLMFYQGDDPLRHELTAYDMICFYGSPEEADEYLKHIIRMMADDIDVIVQEDGETATCGAKRFDIGGDWPELIG